MKISNREVIQAFVQGRHTRRDYLIVALVLLNGLLVGLLALALKQVESETVGLLTGDVVALVMLLICLLLRYYHTMTGEKKTSVVCVCVCVCVWMYTLPLINLLFAL